MRIGITGAQCTGKTTLLNALRSEEMFKNYSICNEVTRRVASYGLPINEGGNDVTQELIMNQHVVNWFMNKEMITDRTALDGYVYSIYLYETGNIKKHTLDYAKRVFDKLVRKYDMLFYIPPEFEPVSDGVRSNDIFFRERVIAIFTSIISEEALPVIYLRGSVRERVDLVIKNINSYKEELLDD